MQVKLDLMSRDEMIEESFRNKGNRYTTEEWQEEGNYVVTNRNGYLEYADGEEVIEEDSLPIEGWFDCTGYEEDEDLLNNEARSCYEDPLYDEDDMY